ncbi:hypothetical protein LJC35_06160 [Parabacteroides sp. OttesenSCG-928-N08]|nr:hypothetical protein [Parabacteroides sp. OttesenSCG-928-N08]
MKRLVTSIYIILLAALVFYGGAGVNIVSFCCNDCRAAGMEVLKEDKCCEIHSHSHHDEPIVEAATNSVGHTHEMCCNLKRIDFNWDTAKAFDFHAEPIAFDIYNGMVSTLTPSEPVALSFISSVMPTGPPLCPRTYLSLLTTLLI